MSGLVLDASSALSWCFETENSRQSDALIDKVAADGAVVPTIWSLELTNALVKAERRRRISRHDSEIFLALMEELPINVDTETSQRAFHETIALARNNAVSTYDASYLELAMRTKLPLATADQALRRAAKRVSLLLADL